MDDWTSQEPFHILHISHNRNFYSGHLVLSPKNDLAVSGMHGEGGGALRNNSEDLRFWFSLAAIFCLSEGSGGVTALIYHTPLHTHAQSFTHSLSAIILAPASRRLIFRVTCTHTSHTSTHTQSHVLTVWAQSSWPRPPGGWFPGRCEASPSPAARSWASPPSWRCCGPPTRWEGEGVALIGRSCSRYWGYCFPIIVRLVREKLNRISNQTFKTTINISMNKSSFMEILLKHKTHQYKFKFINTIKCWSQISGCDAHWLKKDARCRFLYKIPFCDFDGKSLNWICSWLNNFRSVYKFNTNWKVVDGYLPVPRLRAVLHQLSGRRRDLPVPRLRAVLHQLSGRRRDLPVPRLRAVLHQLSGRRTDLPVLRLRAVLHQLSGSSTDFPTMGALVLRCRGW